MDSFDAARSTAANESALFADAEQSDRADEEARRLDEIVRQGPVGAWALAGVATFIVVAIYLIFYVLAYLPRGGGQWAAPCRPNARAIRTARAARPARLIRTPWPNRPSGAGPGWWPASSFCSLQR